MIRSFYTSFSGLMAQEKGMAVTANNVANADTKGFKPDKSAFADLVTTNVYAPQSSYPGMLVGQGSKMSKTDTLFTQGGVSETNRPQDYALTEENQFFAVRSSDGTVKYTRNGEFQLSERASGRFYLADSNGDQVLNGAGQPIVVTNEQQKQPVGVFSFSNPEGLTKTGDNCYLPTALSGGAAAVQGATVKEGFVEDSTVDMTDELSDLIRSNRAFGFNAKLVQMSDEIMQTVNNLR